MRRLRVLSLLIALATQGTAASLVVISVDGLDNRYLVKRDEMGLKIPNLRRLMRTGEVSKGVIGVFPTITWPSHTTIITGVVPVTHGILGNRMPQSQGGDYYWSAHLLHTDTLLDAVARAGMTSATVTWPVTVDAPVNWDLPEYFQRRRGGSMDMRSIESKSKPPDLVSKIAAIFPSFAQEWMDDRSRTLASVYLLQHEHPNLLLVHFVDLDSEEHDNAPFSRESNAILERTDELIGQIETAMPQGYAIAIVSDHGFERVNTMVNITAIAAQHGIKTLTPLGAIVVARDEAAAQLLRQLSQEPRNGIGREIPKDEVSRFPSASTQNAVAIFESAEGVMFSGAPGGPEFSKPAEIGNHGHWPMRYRSVYVAAGPGIPPRELPEFSLKEIANRFAAILDVPFTPGQPSTKR